MSPEDRVRYIHHYLKYDLQREIMRSTKKDYSKFCRLLSPELSQKVYNGSIAVTEHILKLSCNSVEIP